LEQAAHGDWVGKYKKYYHDIPASILAASVARSGRPISGMLAGGLAGIAFGAPSIYKEMVADKYGDRLTAEGDKAKVKNWPFLSSYVASAAIPAAASGGVVGLASLLLNKLRR